MATNPHQIPRLLDVSAAFDNCFFHSVALYFMANHLALPTDLFSFIPLEEDSTTTQLRRIFPHEDSLNLFDAQSPSLGIFERTLVLGFMFREWFAYTLSQDEAAQKNFADNAQNELTTAISFLTEGADIESICSENTLYEAHRDEILNNTPTDATHLKHCAYLAKPYIKIAYRDYLPILKKLGIPYTIYPFGGSRPLAEDKESSSTLLPPLELTLKSGEGHYLLSKLAGMDTSLLEQYERQKILYEQNREQLLKQPDVSKPSVIRMLERSTPLVRSICRKETVSWEPLTAFLSKIHDIKNQCITSQELASGAAMSHLVPDELNTPDSNISSQAISTSPVVAESPEIPNCTPPIIHVPVEAPSNPNHTRFMALLNNLKRKTDELNQRKEKDAYDKAYALYEELHGLANTYFKNSPTPEDTKQFKQHCASAIENARQDLKHYRGNILRPIFAILGEFLLALIDIPLIGAAHFVHKYRTGRYAFFPTDSVKKLDEITSHLKKDYSA